MRWADLLLWIALGASTFLDCRKRWVPNAVTVPLLLSGLVLAGVTGGLPALKESVLGFLFLFGLFALGRGLGVARGGDTKLAAAVGAWLGFQRSYPFLVVWVCLNAIAFLVVSRRAVPSWAHWWDVQRVSLQGLRVGVFHRHGAVSYPGAVTISLATVFTVFFVR